MQPMTTEMIRAIAREEIEEERFYALVEREKERIRKQKWWHRLLPFTITITIQRRNP